MGGDTSAVKKKLDLNPMAERANGKHQVWKAKVRSMDTNTGESPGHQSQSQQLGNSPSEEEMGHWTPMGVEPKDYDDDDDEDKMVLQQK